MRQNQIGRVFCLGEISTYSVLSGSPGSLKMSTIYLMIQHEVLRKCHRFGRISKVLLFLTVVAVLSYSSRGTCVPVILKRQRPRIVLLNSPLPPPASRQPNVRQSSVSLLCRRRMKSWRVRRKRRERDCRKSLTRATGCSQNSWLPKRSCPHWRRPRALWTSRSRTSTLALMMRLPMPPRMQRGRLPSFRPG